VTFIYATCKDTCPLLTAKMAMMQKKLGADFGRRVRFVSITVEPEVDTPAVLKAYAEKFDADPRGWSFLTGTNSEIRDVVGRYGAFAKRAKPGDVDHLFLTSLVDRKGRLRVQYLGYRFDPDEMLRDLRSLLRE
jgi:protein SCO1/2